MYRLPKFVQPPLFRSILKTLKHYPVLRSNRGASLAEFVVVAGVILTILIGTVELSYYVYVRNSVGAALSYAVKRSQTEPNAYVDFNDIRDPSDPRYRNHLYARQVIAEEATAYLAKVGVDAKLHEFTYKDYFAASTGSNSAGSNFSGLTSGTVRAYQNQTLPIAFLGPATGGYFTMPDGSKEWLANGCDEMWKKANPDLAVGQDSPECKQGAAVRAFGESSKKLQVAYPATFTASFSSKVLFGLNSTVTVAGFGAAGEGPAYAAAILNETATPNSKRPNHDLEPTSTATPSKTATELPTNTPTNTKTDTALPTETPRPSPTATWTATSTVTSTPIATDTAVPTSTPVPTDTPVNTPTSTVTATATAFSTPTATPFSTQPPTKTPTASATPTWTSTRTATATTTPTATATPSSAPQCVWVAAWGRAGHALPSDSIYEDLHHMSGQFQYDQLSDVPGCFAEAFGGSFLHNGTLVQSCTESNSSKRGILTFGYCVRSGGATSDTYLARFLGVPEQHDEITPGLNGPGELLRQERWETDLDYETDRQYRGVAWYMDENCRYVEKTANVKLCGFAGVSWSPVSLLWEKGTSLEEGMNVVSFSLSPKQPSAFSLWKGSAQAPLLVFDPKKSGTVSSAAQLFGNYAFGGRIDSLAQVSLAGEKPAWDNGFEALAILDENHDAKLSDKELEPLALWFDKNRDAKVDSGELVSLVSKGVVALYFKEFKASTGSKDLHLEVGYDRIVNGTLTHGSSVDWYAETFSSKQEALQALNAIFSSKGKGQAESKRQLAAAWQRDPMHFTPHRATNHAEDLSGFWRWHLVDDKGVRHPGVFAFEQVDSTTLKGFSVVEAQFEKNSKGLRSGVMISPAEGKINKTPDGKFELKLQVKDPSTGTLAASTAILDETGSTLAGKTNQTFTSDQKLPKRSATVSYSWIAQKFVN